MQSYGLTTFHSLIGDRIVYRNLIPADLRLPSLAELRPQLGLPATLVPRKVDPDYARVVAHLLRLAQRQDAPTTPLQRLLFLGDTRLLDGTAFDNLCQAGGWRGLAFIGTDSPDPAHIELLEGHPGSLYLANRWAALDELDEACRRLDFALDERTAVVIDLDKTAVGARGRNGHVIDQARIEAVRRTVLDLLGDDFDPQAFQTAYDLLNRPQYHPFTADNQDYLCYICLVLGSGLYRLEPLLDELHAGRITGFGQFITAVDGRAEQLPAALRDIHREIYHLVQQGDPTPFKAFRFNEYRTTVRRFGCLPDDAPVEQMLAEEICLTAEVLRAARRWGALGALLFALSDKPDEATFPPPDLAAEGYQPLHRTATHAVGTEP